MSRFIEKLYCSQRLDISVVRSLLPIYGLKVRSEFKEHFLYISKRRFRRIFQSTGGH
jgi:hypothetical protein